MPEEEEERERTTGPDAIPLQESGPKQENFITLLTLHCQSGTCLGCCCKKRSKHKERTMAPRGFELPERVATFPAIYLQQLAVSGLLAVIQCYFARDFSVQLTDFDWKTEPRWLVQKC